MVKSVKSNVLCTCNPGVTMSHSTDVDEEEISFSIVNPPVPEIEINRDNFRPTHEGFSTIKPNATLSKQMMQNNPENEIKNQMMVYKQVSIVGLLQVFVSKYSAVVYSNVVCDVVNNERVVYPASS